MVSENNRKFSENNRRYFRNRVCNGKITDRGNSVILELPLPVGNYRR